MSTISSTTPLWIAARGLLDDLGRDFFKRWGEVATGFATEEIHDFRVASRRLREGLALFAPCFPGKGLFRIGKQVKQVTGALGELRNTDEAILFFSQLPHRERNFPEFEVQELLERLGVERADARRQLKNDLKALKPAPLKSRLREELDSPALFANDRTDPFQGLARFADGALLERARPLGELFPASLDEANAVAQHRLRIAMKRMRYRLEILQPLIRCGYAELHRCFKEYQEVLGTLHDLDVFALLAQDRVAEGTGQQELLQTIRARRNRAYRSFMALIDSNPLHEIAAKARSCL